MTIQTISDRRQSRTARLGVGTVQFGLDYGVANTEGQTSPAEAATILRTAQQAGIHLLDTAAAYGYSEEVLGRITGKQETFDIVTKTLPVKRDNIRPGDVDDIRIRFEASLAHLNREKVYGLLVHEANNLLSAGGDRLFALLEEFKSHGLVSKIGASVYTGDQIDRIMERYPVDMVQLPINIFDQRLIAGGQLTRLRENGIEIHARSVFLQGLLLMPPDTLHPYFKEVKEHITAFHDYCRRTESPPLRTALAFVLNRPEIDHVIVGVCNHAQLSEIIEAVEQWRSIPEDMDRFAIHEEKIVNPSLWKVDRQHKTAAV